MARKLTVRQPPYKMLVANLAGGSDPSRGESGNPVKIRQTFTYQHFAEIGGRGLDHGADPQGKTPGIATRLGLSTFTDPGIPVGATGEIVVDDNDFTAAAVLRLGSYELVSGEHWTPGGTTALSAVALAAAIDALPGFSAPVPGASTITVTGPPGVDGNGLLFEAVYTGSVVNFTLTPVDGSVPGTMSGAEPFIGPPAIT